MARCIGGAGRWMREAKGGEGNQETMAGVGSGSVKHAFTVDLEDWYDGIPIPKASKELAERRLHIGTEHLLERLAARGAKATFFVLSPIAKRHPDLVREIVRAGHDIGSHGVSHELV